MSTFYSAARVAASLSALLTSATMFTTSDAAAAAAIPWPERGQAALAGDVTGVSGDVTSPQPIASVAKVMTAYQVLLDHPLALSAQGPTITVTSSDVAAYRTSRHHGESTVPVVAGENLTEYQALEAMLIPSANNMARILARWDAGSIPAFLDRENRTAARLGMRHSTYTDPSGLDWHTVSTAPDQVILARAAMAVPALAHTTGETQASVPVAGTVHNTNGLLGHDGVIGMKTGFTSRAGGCLMFAVRAHGERAHQGPMMYGVILGQPGGSAQLSAPGGEADRLIVAASESATRGVVRPDR